VADRRWWTIASAVVHSVQANARATLNQQQWFSDTIAVDTASAYYAL